MKYILKGIGVGVGFGLVLLLTIGIFYTINKIRYRDQLPEKTEAKVIKTNTFVWGNQHSDELERFFDALEKKDYEVVYEFGSKEFKRNFPKQFFIERTKNWEFLEFEILGGETLDESGFHFFIKYKEKGSGLSNSSYTVFLWKFEDDQPRFLHIPFRKSGIHDLVIFDCLYERY